MLKQLKGVGEKTLEHFHEAQIFTLYDLIHTYPRKYRHYVLSDPLNAAHQRGYFDATVLARPSVYQVRRQLKRISVPIRVGMKEHRLMFFNQTHWLRHLHPGVAIVFEGNYDSNTKAVQAQTLMLKKNFPAGIVAEYGVPGISDHKLHLFIRQAMRVGGIYAEDPLPDWLLKKRDLIPYQTFIRRVHEPQTNTDIEAVWQRLSYEELLRKQLRALLVKNTLQKDKPRLSLIKETHLTPFIKQLPYTLTNAQKSLLIDLIDRLNEPKSLYHLVQGDTGSGKTVIAFLLAYGALLRGEQAALLAPTETLAMQHHRLALTLFKPLGIEPVLVLGATDQQTKKTVMHSMANETTLFIGTHALFSKQTRYQNLGFVVVDEQHRFGVNQRLSMAQKGEKVDVLYLSATPIPRTLALTIYGDMDVVTLREKPQHRQPIKTTLYPIKKAKALDDLIDQALSHKEQIYLIAPRIEDDDKLLSIHRIAAYYQKRFKQARIGVLHGQRSRDEKEATLTRFANHELDVLIATSVVEVGIDVKQATLMFIFHGERFGLAQLHQLRGRLARGTLPGTCVILYQGPSHVKERLSILEHTDDGFILSEKDLEQRGFGDLLGEAQSGAMRYRYSDEIDLIAQLEAIKEDALTMLANPHEHQRSIQALLALDEES